MHILKFESVAASLIISFLFFSCMTQSKWVKQAKMDTSKVPEGFNPKKHILLIAEMPRLNNPDEANRSVTNKLDKALKENYLYKYEIVPIKEIYANTAKYSDTSIYRYAMVSNLNIYRHTTITTVTRITNHGTFGSSVAPSARTTFIDFHFFDRVAKKEYPNSGNSSTHMEPTVLAFIKLINTAKGLN